MSVEDVAMPSQPGLPPTLVEAAVKAALAEDLGLAGDITTDAIIAADASASARIAARHAGVIAGLDLAEAAFRALDPGVRVVRRVAEGGVVFPGQVVADIEGRARALLSAERVALNFLGRLSGISTLTRAYADAIAGTGARICCTRKTTPGLRAFEKYAVRCGGGVNHRFGLYDAVLIKDNHIAAAGGVGEAIRLARQGIGHLVKIEVEIDTLAQLEEALRHPVDAVLFDNMGLDDLRRAVAMVTRHSGRIVIEASGGVTLGTVRAIAEAGVHAISVGALTHSAPVLDLGLDF